MAIAIGTSHGAYKFKRQPTGDILAIDRIKAIHARLPNTHLVMHGSSSVPQYLLQEIRCYGGDIPETYGVPVEEIQEGIRYGVRKVNIDTDIRLAMTAAMRRTMKKNAREFDPRKFLQAAMEETKKVCIDRFEAFGSAGQAPKVRADRARRHGAALPQRRIAPDRALTAAAQPLFLVLGAVPRFTDYRRLRHTSAGGRTPMPALTRAIAEFAAALEPQAIPETCRRGARIGMLDCVGVMIAGAKRRSAADRGDHGGDLHRQ